MRQLSKTCLLRGLARGAPLIAAALAAAAVWVDDGPISAALAAVLVVWCGWAGLQRRRDERALAEAARLQPEYRILRECVEYNPLAFAVYDERDELIAWNRSYETIHAEAFRRLRPRLAQGRVTYAELIGVTETALHGDKAKDFVAQRLKQQRQATGVGVDREYPGLGWLRVSKFATPSGAVAGFAVDINELKQREAALQQQIRVSEDLARRLRELADTDGLTGARSRRAFLDRATEEFNRSRRYQRPLAMAVLDLDHFKKINDTYGHAVGDEVLAAVATTCVARLRDGADVFGRLGGEEFGILLPETDLAGAAVITERLLDAVRTLRFEAEGRAFHVSASMGMAIVVGSDVAFAHTMARADAALYQAKRRGRDRIELATA